MNYSLKVGFIDHKVPKMHGNACLHGFAEYVSLPGKQILKALLKPDFIAISENTELK